MRRIFNAFLALGLVGAGGAAIAAVVWLQSDRFALTSLAGNEPRTEPPVPAERADLPSHFLPKSSAAHQVADVAVPPPAIPAVGPKPVEDEPKPRLLVPCSGWIDMGPAAIAREGEPERRHVQLLCPEDSIDAKQSRPGA